MVVTRLDMVSNVRIRGTEYITFGIEGQPGQMRWF